jgi:Fe2+ or Zn2+ uptake regulation protein
MLTTSEYKTCLDCDERVKAAARICRHCGFVFDFEAETPTRPADLWEAHWGVELNKAAIPWF